MKAPSFSPFPQLETKRLILRRMTLDDRNEVFAIRSNEGVAKYLDRPVYKSMEEAEEFMHKIETGINKNSWVYWAVSLKDNPKLIGTICLWQINFKKATAEIGFELHPDYQRKGCMREAVAAVIDYGFNTMELSAIEGEVAPENTPSVKILTLFGFKLLPAGENKPTVIYRLDK